MKKIFLAALMLLGADVLQAQSTPSWLRYPAISPDGSTVVFTYKGDLYKVPTAGGTAIQLTQHEAEDCMPVWSSDSKSIAFASDRYGNFDIFIIPATGGSPKRVTFHSNPEFPYSFTLGDKEIVFGASRMDAASNRQFPTAYMTELYKVGTNGGRVEQMLTTPAENVSFSKDGSFMLYQDKKGGENQWRKHHVSAIARDIWKYDFKTAKHTQLTTNKAEDRNPILAADNQTMYYLSEADGSFNVYQTSIANSSSAQQLTHFNKAPVRFLSRANNGTICFSYDGDLYTIQNNGTPTKINIQISIDEKNNNERNLPVMGNVSGMAVSPNGKEVAYIFRGEVFVSAVEGSATKRITNTPERETTVSFSPDGRKLIYGSERNGKWRIFEASIVRKEEPYFYAATLTKETQLISSDKENYLPKYSPDGKEVAFIENRAFLKVLNLASKQTRTILTDSALFSWRDNDQSFSWSPDGKWFAFDYSIESVANGEIGLISSDGKGKIVNLTQNGFNDGDAKWMMDGKMIMYSSDRDGLRSKANSGGSQSDVWAYLLTQDAWDKFKLGKDDAALVKEMEEKAAKADTGKNKAKKDSTVKIDWDGLKYRKAKLTIHSSDLGDAVVSKNGETLYYLARFEKGYNLWTTNLRTQETKQLAGLNANFAQLQWDKEQKTLFVQADGSLSKIDPTSGKQERISTGGDMLLNAAQERAFMFEHVWRRTKTTFYTAGYHGAPWDVLKTDYEKFLPHIGNNFEFAEMLSEMLGELNVSHCGASYNAPGGNNDATASIGAFYDATYKGIGVKIEEVIAEGPLDKAGFNILSGMIIEAVDGDTIAPNKDLSEYLNRKAGKNTLLSILMSNGTRKEITVKPISLGAESGLLYKRWVRRNEEEVTKLSGGKLGYVHIPGMNDNAFRAAYEEIMGKFGNSKAIVIDTRNNGGGDLVSDLAAFLTGKAYMYNATDNRVISYEPTFRWNRPSISLANEGNYSDGHCYAFGYQNLGIGKLVGMPTPGTCTFAGWESLQDPSIRWGVPPVGVKMMDGKYLENHQTTPDIVQMNEYDKVNKGVDQQLEIAVKTLLGDLK
jgi:tricorn protease